MASAATSRGLKASDLLRKTKMRERSLKMESDSTPFLGAVRSTQKNVASRQEIPWPVTPGNSFK